MGSTHPVSGSRTFTTVVVYEGGCTVRDDATTLERMGVDTEALGQAVVAMPYSTLVGEDPEALQVEVTYHGVKRHARVKTLRRGAVAVYLMVEFDGAEVAA